MKHSSFDATIPVLDAETSALGVAIARSYWQYWRRVFGYWGVGVTPQMCSRVTNHGEMGTFSRPAAQWLMGRLPCKYAKRCMVDLKKKNPYWSLRNFIRSSQGKLVYSSVSMYNWTFIFWHAIVEETLTSGKYISVFLISILKIYIWNLKNYVTTGVFFEKIMQKLASRENYVSRDQMHHFFIILQVLQFFIILHYSFLLFFNVNCHSIQATIN